MTTTTTTTTTRRRYSDCHCGEQGQRKTEGKQRRTNSEQRTRQRGQ